MSMATPYLESRAISQIPRYPDHSLLIGLQPYSVVCGPIVSGSIRFTKQS
jgi:hypothetical protein